MLSAEKMTLHDMVYFVVTDSDSPPVAYPEAGWDVQTSRPRSSDVEQCDCVETAVDYYRLHREVLFSEGKPVLSERDARILDAILDIQEGRPRKPRHALSDV